MDSVVYVIDSCFQWEEVQRVLSGVTGILIDRGSLCSTSADCILESLMDLSAYEYKYFKSHCSVYTAKKVLHYFPWYWVHETRKTGLTLEMYWGGGGIILLHLLVKSKQKTKTIQSYFFPSNRKLIVNKTFTSCIFIGYSRLDIFTAQFMLYTTSYILMSCQLYRIPPFCHISVPQ